MPTFTLLVQANELVEFNQKLTNVSAFSIEQLELECARQLGITGKITLYIQDEDFEEEWLACVDLSDCPAKAKIRVAAKKGATAFRTAAPAAAPPRPAAARPSPPSAGAMASPPSAGAMASPRLAEPRDYVLLLGSSDLFRGANRLVKARAASLGELCESVQIELGYPDDVVLTLHVDNPANAVPITDIQSLPLKAKVQAWPAEKFSAIATQSSGAGVAEIAEGPPRDFILLVTANSYVRATRRADIRCASVAELERKLTAEFNLGARLGPIMVSVGISPSVEHARALDRLDDLPGKCKVQLWPRTGGVGGGGGGRPPPPKPAGKPDTSASASAEAQAREARAQAYARAEQASRAAAQQAQREAQGKSNEKVLAADHRPRNCICTCLYVGASCLDVPGWG